MKTLTNLDLDLDFYWKSLLRPDITSVVDCALKIKYLSIGGKQSAIWANSPPPPPTHIPSRQSPFLAYLEAHYDRDTIEALLDCGGFKVGGEVEEDVFFWFPCKLTPHPSAQAKECCSSQHRETQAVHAARAEYTHTHTHTRVRARHRHTCIRINNELKLANVITQKARSGNTLLLFYAFYNASSYSSSSCLSSSLLLPGSCFSCSVLGVFLSISVTLTSFTKSAPLWEPQRKKNVTSQQFESWLFSCKQCLFCVLCNLGFHLFNINDFYCFSSFHIFFSN